MNLNELDNIDVSEDELLGIIGKGITKDTSTNSVNETIDIKELNTTSNDTNDTKTININSLNNSDEIIELLKELLKHKKINVRITIE